jgi:stage II sporulation protein D
MPAIANQTAVSPFHQFQLFLAPLLNQKRTWLMSVIWFVLVAPAQAAELRVAIQEGVRQLQVGSSTPATVRDAAGQALGKIQGMEPYRAVNTGGRISLNRWQSNQIWIEPSNAGAVFIGDRWYRGRTLLVNQPTGLTAINYVETEQYLYSVVGSEMPASWHLEALKAQAVASRTYAMNRAQVARNQLFDVKDTVASQVYKGMSQETARTQQAVAETTNQVLTYDGKVINAVFHAASGGHTENVEDVWSKFIPYLRGVPDFDNSAPNARWSTVLTSQFMRQRITGIGSITQIKPEQLTQTGRFMTVRVSGTQGQRILDADKLRSLLGLKSTWLDITPVYGRVAASEAVPAVPVSFQIMGRGHGHGIGMSQWGALGLSQQGYRYDQILSYYYQGTQLSTLKD